jgi:hypothetical protein
MHRAKRWNAAAAFGAADDELLGVAPPFAEAM